MQQRSGGGSVGVKQIKKKERTGHHVCKKNNYVILTASAIKGSPARLNEVPIN